MKIVSRLQFMNYSLINYLIHWVAFIIILKLVRNKLNIWIILMIWWKVLKSKRYLLYKWRHVYWDWHMVQTKSVRNCDGRAKGVERIAKEWVVGGDEAPLILPNIIDFAWHVIVATYDIDFILNIEGFVADTKLVHVVQGLPILSVQIEQVNLSITVRILSANKQDFTIGDSEGTTSPKRILHSNGQHLPLVLFDLVHFNRIVDFLLSTSKEATKSVDKFVSDWTSTKVVPLIFHRSHLIPFVFVNIVFFNWA